MNETLTSERRNCIEIIFELNLIEVLLLYQTFPRFPHYSL